MLVGHARQVWLKGPGRRKGEEYRRLLGRSGKSDAWHHGMLYREEGVRLLGFQEVLEGRNRWRSHGGSGNE
jgi:hypothetical protein